MTVIISLFLIAKYAVNKEVETPTEFHKYIVYMTKISLKTIYSGQLYEIDKYTQHNI